ncbi:multidrug efflux SMR transporter [Acinetobacter sp. B5B]|uniref:DMT family transporter n=1 Tax=Acinetobacter baretiae TaxID=2605383 RepID=UPI0018C2D574|nr:multidrug efflux SMR transporter [Acinetobacter baretiae]MBF7683499.1 multidrug efflux SMR transporter [Acinetobacter baretiae]MBF7684805.1 multidrug efflux SMR transporter [Acinetobacter baretiae]
MPSFILANLGYLYLACVIIIDILMMFFLTQAHGFSNYKATVLSLVCYAITFVFAGLALKHLPMSVVYALWGGLGAMGCAVVAHFFMGQKLNLPVYIGMGLIVVGVVMVELFSESSS